FANTALTAVAIPPSMTSISNDAFDGITSGLTVTISSPTIAASATASTGSDQNFYGASNVNITMTVCTITPGNGSNAANAVAIPNSYTTIANN
mgnify:CR=1